MSWMLQHYVDAHWRPGLAEACRPARLRSTRAQRRGETRYLPSAVKAVPNAT
jgi:hypothetical protein